jgi:hypothetical protein
MFAMLAALLRSTRATRNIPKNMRGRCLDVFYQSRHVFHYNDDEETAFQGEVIKKPIHGT